VLLATALDEALDTRARRPWPVRRARWAIAIMLLAVVPILPLPLRTGARSELPRFFTGGDWRGYLPAGRTMVSIPPSTSYSPDAQRWQTATGFAFPIDGGYFLGPGQDGRSHVGPVPTATYTLLKQVSSTGVPAPVDAADRERAQQDLRYWNAGLVVLPDPRPGVGGRWGEHYEATRRTAIELFGPGRHVDDVTIWRPSS